MVTRAGQVKVMDFGIARLQTDATAPQTSSVIGTPAYFSPEQAQGQPVDARSDIYSLGCVLYELLAHRQPFTGDTPVAIAYKQVNEMPVPPSEVNPDVPPRLDAVVMKCMAKNPANRYQSAAELNADLERVRPGQEVEATPLLPAGDAGATQVIARQPTQVMPPAGARGLVPEDVARRPDRDPRPAAAAGRRVPPRPEPEQGRHADPGSGRPTSRAMPYDEAKATLEAQGFVVGRDTQEPADQYQPNIVLAQDPKAEHAYRRSARPSRSPSPCRRRRSTVPDLQCISLADAATQLGTTTSRSDRRRTTTSDACPPDTIVDQNPKAGTQVNPGTHRQRHRGERSEHVILADYTCQTFNKASHDLEKLGLVAVLGGPVPSPPAVPERRTSSRSRNRRPADRPGRQHRHALHWDGSQRRRRPSPTP